MFIRATPTRSNTTGKHYFTYRLVKGVRLGGKVKQVVLHNLGRHFPTDKAYWRTLAQRSEELLASHAFAPTHPNQPAATEPPMYTSLPNCPSYVTKDGSAVRELMHPDHHPVRHQSLAEARVAPGARTALHRHPRTEELYHITAGSGQMTLGAEAFAVQAGDTVLIPPGMSHQIENNGDGELVLLCCCAPAYSHGDTELL